jgi:hypothetical protein
MINSRSCAEIAVVMRNRYPGIRDPGPGGKGVWNELWPYNFVGDCIRHRHCQLIFVDDPSDCFV